MACLNSRQGGCGCRVAAQNARQTQYCGVNSASPCVNYEDAARWYPSCPHPYYCGPCGPVEPTNTCTAHCPPGSVPPPCPPYPPYPPCPPYPPAPPVPPTPPTPRASVYGYFSQTGSLTVEAGSAVPFSGPSNASGITTSAGAETLSAAGIYMATLSVTLPADATLSNTFSLQMNGATVPGGSIVVNKISTDGPLYASAQTVFSAPANAALRVISSAEVNLTAASASDPIVTLTIVKIG